MKIAWIIVLISAFTDFVITMGTGLSAAMVATDSAAMPSGASVLLCVIGGLVQAARTVQQALKATPETAAALRGSESTVITNTVERTP